MKYIIFDENGLELPIIFPEIIRHDSIRNVFSNYPVVSAGFCRFYAREAGVAIFSCWGESVSLKVKSRKEDSEVLSRVNENY